MSTRDISLLKSLSIAILVFSIAIVIVFARQNTTGEAEAVGMLVDTPAPTVGDIQTVVTTSVHSSHADKELQLRRTQLPDRVARYEYIVTDMGGANPRLLYEKTLPAGALMTLPDNSWDPTDTYVFLEEIDNGAPNYYVMKSTGGPIIDVGAVWKEKKIPYVMRTATGWASETLLILYTSKSDGSRGPAYWFEVPSTAILQLAD